MKPIEGYAVPPSAPDQTCYETVTEGDGLVVPMDLVTRIENYLSHINAPGAQEILECLRQR